MGMLAFSINEDFTINDSEIFDMMSRVKNVDKLENLGEFYLDFNNRKSTTKPYLCKTIDYLYDKRCNYNFSKTNITIGDIELFDFANTKNNDISSNIDMVDASLEAIDCIVDFFSYRDVAIEFTGIDIIGVFRRYLSLVDNIVGESIEFHNFDIPTNNLGRPLDESLRKNLDRKRDAFYKVEILNRKEYFQRTRVYKVLDQFIKDFDNYNYIKTLLKDLDMLRGLCSESMEKWFYYKLDNDCKMLGLSHKSDYLYRYIERQRD